MSVCLILKQKVPNSFRANPIVRSSGASKAPLRIEMWPSPPSSSSSSSPGEPEITYYAIDPRNPKTLTDALICRWFSSFFLYIILSLGLSYVLVEIFHFVNFFKVQTSFRKVRVLVTSIYIYIRKSLLYFAKA